MEGINKDIIDAYFSKIGDINFSKTSSRSILSTMNGIVSDSMAFNEYIDRHSKIQRYINIMTGTILHSTKNKNNEYIYPIEETYKCF